MSGAPPAAAAASAAATRNGAAPGESHTDAELPPTVLAIRTRGEIQFVRGPFPRSFEGVQPAGSAPVEHSIPCGDHNFVYSSDGCLLAVLTGAAAAVYDCTVWPPALRFSVERPAIVHCAFSPLHSHLVTYERKSAKSAENLHVWATATGECVLSFFQSREVAVDCWPLQWTADERLLCHQVSNELHVHDGAAPSTQVLARLQVAGLTQFSLSPSAQSPYSLATFSPVKATDPARIAIYTLDGGSLSTSAPLSRSVYKAEEMSIRWSVDGRACLVETTTATDSTGKSYFGTSHLHLFSLDSAAPFTVTVDFAGNDGPVHDFCFLPNARQEFLVVQGYQPAVSTLFSVQSGACVAVKQYGKAPRNTIRVSPHSRFLMLGGFGNLSGEMDLFDSWKFKRIGECCDRDGAKSEQWTNDSRHLVLAVLRPWRRVLNGYKVFDYSGALVLHRQYEELYQVAVQPVRDAASLYPNRPASPGLKDRRAAAASAAANSSQPVAHAAAAAAAAHSAYVPPHLRGRQGGEAVNVVAAMIADDKGREKHKRIGHNSHTTAGAHSGGSAQAGSGGGGGGKQLSKQSHSSAAAAASKGGGSIGAVAQLTASSGPQSARDSTTESDAKAGNSALAGSSVAAAAVEAAVDESALSGEACEKRLRAAVKKQRQVAELLERKTRGQQLEQSQEDKLRTAGDLEAEVERLRQRIQYLATSIH